VNLSSTGIVPLTVRGAPAAPVCTAGPNLVSAADSVTIHCTVDANTVTTIPGANCPTTRVSAAGTNITCTGGTGASLGNNPTATSTNDVNLSSTGIVPLTVRGAPAAPVCTAGPNLVSAADSVTIHCTVDANTVTTIPGATCPTTRTSAAGTNITCTGGTGASLGNNPTATSTNDVNLSSTGIVPLTVRGAPAAPVCTADPNLASAADSVTIHCTVDANTVTTIPGATCPTSRTGAAGTTITCTGGTGGSLGNNPTATSTNDVNLSSTGTVSLTVRGAPVAPVCTANPNLASATDSVTITCTVDANTVTTIPGATCPTDRTTVAGANITCTGGTGGSLGNNPTATSTNDVNLSSTGTVSLTVRGAPVTPVCTANPSLASATDSVTITCAVDANTVTTIPGATCPPDRTTTATHITCSGGTGGSLGSNPTATSTNDVNLSSTGTVPLTVKGAPAAPVCTADPNPASATDAVTITCEVDAHTVTTITGASCPTDFTATATRITCSGTGGSVGGNTTAKSTNDVNLSSTGIVQLTLRGAPAAPVCTASPSLTKADDDVTITCEVDAHTVTTIPHATCPTTRATTATRITCMGIGSELGNNPTATSTNDVRLTSTGPVTLTLRGTPAAPVCTADPKLAKASASVTITCEVDAHTVTTIPGADCPTDRTTAATTITCTGTASDLHDNPTATSTNDVNLSNTGTALLTVRAAPAAPVCTADPNPADPSATVTITCEVDAHTVTTIPHAICPTARTTAATTITCIGFASLLGNDPTATSTDDVDNASTGLVPLTLRMPAQPIPALSDWSLIALALLLLGLSGMTLRRGARR